MGPTCNHKGPPKREKEDRSQSGETGTMEAEVRVGRTMSLEMQAASRSQKRPGKDFLLQSPKGMQPC